MLGKFGKFGRSVKGHVLRFGLESRASACHRVHYSMSLCAPLDSHHANLELKLTNLSVSCVVTCTMHD